MKVNRTKAVMINSGFALTAQLINLVLSFAVRTMLIKTLGSEFNGLNGLFSNIVNILSFAELGIGSAISFSLYAPLASGDNDQVAAIMKLYKSIYNFVALFIVVIGCAITPFLTLFIKGSTKGLGNVHIAFILFIGNVVVSYLMSYKRTILIANQQSYLDSLNRMVFTVISQTLQIVLLVLYPNYYVFLTVTLVSTLLSNVQIWGKVNKEFPYLNKKSSVPIEPKVIQYLKKNVFGMLSFKLGNIVITGTDNIVLSSFVGLNIVGMYANYTLILTGITSLMNSVVNSITASIGNLANSGDEQREKNVFFKINSANATLAITIAVGLVSFLPVFIKIWLGKEYIFTGTVTLLIVLNFLIAQLRNGLINYLNAYGLYWQQRYKSIFEASINLIISLILITQTNLGISAVLIGTLMSSVLVDLWWEPLIVVRSAIKVSYGKFMVFYIIQLLLGLLILIESQWISKFFNPEALMIKGTFLTIVLIMINVCIFLIVQKAVGNLLSFKTISLKDIYIRIRKRV